MRSIRVARTTAIFWGAIVGSTVAGLTTLALPPQVAADGNPPKAQLPPATAVVDVSIECGGNMVWASSGLYETGLAWQFDGVQEGGYGAFADRLQSERGVVLCLFLDLAQTGNQNQQQCDLLVWADEEEDGTSHPGAVLAIRTGVGTGTIALWPSISRHHMSMDGPCVEGAFWAGFAATWYGEAAGYYIGADLDSGEGVSMTNVAPGLGYPSGWQEIGTIWEPVGSLGIGAEMIPEDCELSPVQEQSWGRIKRLYEEH